MNTSEKRILEVYEKIKPQIDDKIKTFEQTWESGDEPVFKEMVFCLLTPQSKAEVCWQTTEEIFDDGSVYFATADQLANKLIKVRFRNNKARYIVELRNKFVKKGKPQVKEFIESFENNIIARDWLAKNIKGYGMKEASHFLRNVGRGEDIAILDRHILRQLVELGIIEKIPLSISKKLYKELEEKICLYLQSINISLQHFDFVVWYNQTNRIFK
jgi:N-glycosylase/DNA lyase